MTELINGMDDTNPDATNTQHFKNQEIPFETVKYRKRRQPKCHIGVAEVNDAEELNSFVGRVKEKRFWLFISKVKDHITENMVITHLEKKCDRKDLLSVKELSTYKKKTNVLRSACNMILWTRPLSTPNLLRSLVHINPYEEKFRSIDADEAGHGNKDNKYVQNSSAMDNQWSLKTLNKKFIKKFNTHLLTYQIHLNETSNKTGGSLDNEKINLGHVLKTGLQNAKKQAGYVHGDKIRVIVQNDGFNHPISTETTTNINVDNILDHIENIVTSNQEVDIRGTSFDVQIFKMPRGKGRPKIINLTENRLTKRSITRINNSDNLCGPRAIITALSYHTDELLGKKLSKSDIKDLRMGRYIQTILAQKLCWLLGGSYENGFSLEDFKKAEKLLDVQIKIICAENFNSIIYEGDDQDNKLYLYKNKNHFDVINNLKGLYGRHFYCYKCDTGYDNKNIHKCKKQPLCNLCKQPQHDSTVKKKTYCAKCNRFCYNDECLANHDTVCSEVYKCTGCNKLLSRQKFHKCGFSLCFNCRDFVETATHQCFMVKKPAKGGFCKVPCECNGRGELNTGCRYNKENQDSPICKEPCVCNGLSDEKIARCTYNEKYIFFDYEAQQGTGIHIPNLVIAHDFEGNKFTFKNNEDFCKWLISEQHRGYTAIAHNAKGYDSYFILKYCVENTIKPFTIYNGSKLMLLEISPIKLKIIDSSNFVAGPLANFPKTFDLKETCKGYFPHFFNTPENQKYVGPIPGVEFYGVNTMKPPQRAGFLKWHAERVGKNYIFDFQKEIHTYCESDVDILRQGCLAFRKEFLNIANIDPFQYLTIASVCMAIFRSKYLSKKTIALLETEKKDTYSQTSIRWLNQFTNVRHALNGGEVHICGSKVDGYDKVTNTVYQFHGCFWHGCPKCFTPSTVNNVNFDTMEDLFEKTSRRSQQLKEGGYNLVEIWECDWLKSKEFKKTEPVKMMEPLKPRESFFGGRTNASKLRVTGKKCRYIDVVSLYPSVQFYDYYPVGHPTKIFNPTEYNPEWFGLVKCTVLPPQKLYHPVLPVKTTKLTFALCRSCMENETETCNHTVNERVFTGIWTTAELKKALEKGYEIIQIDEVWHFPQKSNDLFKDYIRDFMKIKLEASPHKYESNTAYAKIVKDQMGIDLDIDKIAPNPGKRAVAKICLNSLWGKFGQKQNMSETEYVTDVKSWYNILLDDKIEISNCIFLNDDMVQVTYKYKEVFVEDSTSTNIFIATFTTSNARLRLYEMLDKLGENIVYYDTDSIIYIDDGLNTVKTGEMLGEWSDELGEDDHIVDFLSTGPKSYYYKTLKGIEVTKIKGFTLNYENSEMLNNKGMLEAINNPSTEIKLVYDQITRNTCTKDILTRKRVSKTFRMDYKKRRTLDPDVDDVLNTVPWGY
ncbi:unnamed protein product [Psylliodes chrysocephalus]|uniref:DNA-directed DNA polymerase n=1 Tax=Psylliodes chrysocephalus TaxID=3402493 RepID=A0A9P0G6F1_9CUCU|nr:unnamed protein product [Psylliodes chrysocephala]